MSTTYSRREFLARGAVVTTAAGIGLPLFGRVGHAFGQTAPDPATRLRNRLLVIHLAGGNDGLNTVVPMADVPGALRRSVYDKVRPGIGYAPGRLLPLDRPADVDHQLGLNPTLVNLHGMYGQGRLALLQGVDYPDHSFSHFASTDIWQSGVPGGTGATGGWLGRHLDRVGVGEAEVRGLAIERNLPLILRGRAEQGVNIDAIPLSFRDGNQAGAPTIARHDAAKVFATWPATDPLRLRAGQNAAGTVDLVTSLQNETTPAKTNQALVDALQLARILLEGDYGTEVVHLSLGGFDSHAQQHTLQEKGLREVDYAVQTLLYGDAAKSIPAMRADVADRTMIMIYTEFGRRIGQNGSQGTDHGAATPIFLIAGPPQDDTSPTSRLIGGIHTDHPDMGTVLATAENLVMTTDMRTVNQTVLTEWLSDPDPDYPTTTLPVFTAA